MKRNLVSDLYDKINISALMRLRVVWRFFSSETMQEMLEIGALQPGKG
jgi:hypothetical protein